MMTEEVARQVGAWIREHRPKTVDITGGAPEISGFFNDFVETARSVGSQVIDRNNLTIIATKSHAYLPEYLAKHEVFDGDFNQLLRMQQRAGGEPLHWWDIPPESMAAQKILTANHCLGCNAGHESSRTGALEEPASHKILLAG